MNLSAERLVEFERKVYSRQYTEALDSLQLIIKGLEFMETRFQNHQFELDVKSRIYTRLASAISSMIADRSVEVSEKFLEFLMVYKRGISDVFRVTSFQAMDHLIVNAIDENNGQTGFASKSNLYKALFACTLGNDAMDPMQLLQQIPLKERGLFWLSLVNHRHLMTEKEEQQYRIVAAAYPLIEDSTVPEPLFVRVVNAGFYASYHVHADKHDVKIGLNSLLSNSLRQVGIKDPNRTHSRTIGEKPKLAVLAEMFKSGHAMYRCYGPAIKELSAEFNMTLFAREEAVDEVSGSLFDQVEIFSAETPLKQIVGKLVKLSPDLVFYPSLGMDTWTVPLTLLRLAPIQFMALGHPATSMSDKIDYVIVPEFILGDPSCFSETVVKLKDGAIPLALHPKFQELSEPVVRTDPEVVRVAVPCNELKLNEAFIRLCEEISARAERPFEFHFFPNASELYLLHIQRFIGTRLPAKFHMPTHYVDYMEALRLCDMQISTIPFGNTNGYLVGLTRALPIVSMSGPEVHSSIDNAFGKKAGLPNFCLTETQEDFVSGVVRLINNDAERVEISNRLLELDIEKVFCSTSELDDLSDAVHWMYEHHERIQSDDRKVWAVEDRLELE